MEARIKDLLDKKGRQVYTIQASASVYDAIKEMDSHGVGSLIVKDGAKFVGIVTERDYLRKVTLKGRVSRDTKVATIMSRDLVVIAPDDRIEAAMGVMTEKRCRHLPVIKDGELDGIVTVGDVVKAVIDEHEFKIHMLEEYMYWPLGRHLQRA